MVHALVLLVVAGTPAASSSIEADQTRGAIITDSRNPADLNLGDFQLRLKSKQFEWLAIGNGTPPTFDQVAGNLSLLGATTWGIETNESPALELIDRTNNVRRAVFDTSGNVYLGSDIACVTGCNAGLSYLSDINATVARGKISTQFGLIDHGAAVFDGAGSTNTEPVHVKTSVAASSGFAFRYEITGYDWGNQTEVRSVCVGTVTANGITGPGCSDQMAGATTSMYVSSDGFLVVRVSAPAPTQLGFAVSAEYFPPQNYTNLVRVTYDVLRSDQNL